MGIARAIVMLPVASLEASITFYSKLGFAPAQRRDDWGWAMLQCGETRIMIDRSINAQPRAPRMAVLYLYADDVRTFHDEATRRGLDLPALDTTFYGMLEFRVDDPDGNRLWIGQDRSAPNDEEQR